MMATRMLTLSFIRLGLSRNFPNNSKYDFGAEIALPITGSLPGAQIGCKRGMPLAIQPDR
jgi:hypothetical protein